MHVRAAPIELVIFDCDGVLLDSERLSVKVDVELMAELGWTVTEAEVIELFMGRPEAAIRADVEARLGRPLPPDWEERCRPRYLAAFEAVQPIPGVLEALDRIILPSCVASSSTHEQLRFKLRRAGLWERFEGRIFSADNVSHGKPAPDLFLHAARHMGVAPEACVVVEDSRPGVEAARSAGIRVIGYIGPGGLTPPERLAGPETVLIDDMRALPELLDRLARAEAA